MIARRVATLVALAALAVALGGGDARAQEHVVATTTVDRNIITIGDPIKVSVVVEAQDGYRIIPPPPLLTRLADLEVLDTLPVLQGAPSRGATRYTFRYFVTSFRLGDFVVPGFQIDYDAPDGAEGSAAPTTPIAIRVRSVIQPGEDASDVRPLKPQLELPGALTSRLVYWGALGGALVVILAPAILLFRAARRRRHPVVVLDPSRTPVQQALRELRRIASLNLPDKGRHEEHYTLLGTALRAYLAAQFGIPATRRTARELRGEMERAGVERRQAAQIHEILRESEAVRFQRVSRHPRHAQEALAAAVSALAKAAAAERPEVEVAS